MKKFGVIFTLLFLTQFIKSQNADIDILKRINRLDSPFMTGFCNTMATSGEILAVAVPVGIGIYGLIDRESGMLNKAIVTGASVIGTFAISYGLKYAVGRKRPYEKYPGVLHPRHISDSPSFPSSHTSVAFALATSLSLEFPKWYIIAPSYAWAACVGLARMNQGVHYPSDILGGIVIGAGTAYLSYRINKWWLKKRETKASAAILNAYSMNAYSY